MDKKILISIIIIASFIPTILYLTVLQSEETEEYVNITENLEEVLEQDTEEDLLEYDDIDLGSQTLSCREVCSIYKRTHSRCEESRRYERYCTYLPRKNVTCNYNILDFDTKESNIYCGGEIFNHCVCYNAEICGESQVDCKKRCTNAGCTG